MPTEKLELWRRNPVEVIKDLMGNEALRDALQYAPERAYTDREGRNRVYDEMWTASWWWDTQVCASETTVKQISHPLIRKSYPLDQRLRRSSFQLTKHTCPLSEETRRHGRYT